MFRRLSSTTLTLTFTFTGIAALIAMPAHSSPLGPPEQTASPSKISDVDWGPNHDGWNVTLTNSANEALEFSSHSWRVDNPPTILEVGETTNDIRGEISGLGGPANLGLVMRPVDQPEAEHRFVFISSNNQGDTSVSCGAATYGWYGSNPQSPDKRCTIHNDTTNEPIDVEFTW